MWTISKSFTFSASHQLAGLADEHPCSRLHGHNYVVELELTGAAVDRAGMLVDFGELRQFGRMLDRVFDHRHLNDVLDANPTSEALAFELFLRAREMFPQTAAVTVRETPTTSATYRREVPPC